VSAGGCTEIAEGVFVCRPSTVTYRAVRKCPACGERRRQVGSFAVWYDTTWTCLGCGDSYDVEGIYPRPFARGWREKAKQKARQRWAAALPRAEAHRIAQAMVAEYVS
jgi:hypothetical protein